MTGLNMNEVEETSMIVYAAVKQITNVCIDATYTEIERVKKRCNKINKESYGDVFATWVTSLFD